MEIVDVTATPHQLPAKIFKHYGRAYTFRESLQMGGSGSPRLQIQPGNPSLDTLIQNFKIVPKAHFQLLAKGLLLRIHTHQKVHLLAMHYEEIESIQFHKLSTLKHWPASAIHRRWPVLSPLVHRLMPKIAKIHLKITNEAQPFIFESGSGRALQKFFDKSFFEAKLSFHYEARES